MFAASSFHILVVMWASCQCFKMVDFPKEIGQEDPLQTAEVVSGQVDGLGDGLDGLTKNLNFLLKKVAQLETLAEMQQAEIASLKTSDKMHLMEIESLKKVTGLREADPMHLGILLEEAESLQKNAQSRLHETTEIMKKVWSKHERQRRTGEFHQRPGVEDSAGLAAEKTGENETWGRIGRAVSSVTNRVKSFADDPVGALEDGWNAAKNPQDKVNWAHKQLSEHTISTVEQASKILQVLGLSGFSEFSVSLSMSRKPSFKSFNKDGLKIDFGQFKFKISLVGESVEKSLNFGEKSIGLPRELKTVVEGGNNPIKGMFVFFKELVKCKDSGKFTAMAKCVGDHIRRLQPPLGFLPSPVRTLARAPLAAIEAQITAGKELVDCINRDKADDLMKCLGTKIIAQTPPLNFLNHLSDFVTDFVEVFAKITAAVVEKAMEDGPALVQTAATSAFPKPGEKRQVHHRSTNLIVESHSRQSGRSWMPREASALQEDSRGAPKSTGAITYKMGNGDDVHATALITQFDGKETATSSCLAFAPKTRSRSDKKVTKGDWQVENKGDFLQLEPWAVPCDNQWMKDNVNKWQGYSFYASSLAIERCVTVTFQLGLQPVVALIGGLQFEILPKPLFELASTVCWPNQQPGGVDLSVLRTEVRSAGILLFSRTLRLTKRFGGGTDFVPENAYIGHQTWRHPAGISKGESRAAFEPMSRTSFLQSNESLNESVTEEVEDTTTTEDMYWKADSEDLYLASMDYGENMSVNKTAELFGHEAARRMAHESGDVFELFSFKHPGMVGFKIRGLLDGKSNQLSMGLEMGFGPYRSPDRVIPLVDIGKQFSIALAGMPFVSRASKNKAITALRDFTLKDMGKAQGMALKPGTQIAVYSPKYGRYIKMNDNGLTRSYKMTGYGIPDHWTRERYTVVNAGGGQIALHCAKYNRYVGIGGRSPKRDVHDFPKGWNSEKFMVVEAGNGEVGFYNKAHNRFLKMTNNGMTFSSHPSEKGVLPGGWSQERFRILPGERILQPGSVIALHSARYNRFVKMDGKNMVRSGRRGVNKLPYHWTMERFTVVNAGSRRIALHNTRSNRFIGVAKSSPHKAPNKFPSGWASEKWEVTPAGDGQITLYNRANDRMLRMTGTTVTQSSHKQPKHLPVSWTQVRFQVVHVKPYLRPGSVVALRCKHHGRFLKLNPNSVGRSAKKGKNQLPDSWTSERFTVVDAGNGQVAFHNSKRYRFLQMSSSKMKGSPHMAASELPATGMSWERFTVIYAGSGLFAFHNTKHNRMIRMSNERVDRSGKKSPQDLPKGWSWERWEVVLAKPFLQPGSVVALHSGKFKRYIKMSGDKMKRSAKRGFGPLPAHWLSEQFTVVDAGYGQVAFYNARWGRFIRMSGSKLKTTSKRAATNLPSHWASPRFTVFPAGSGTFAFHNTDENRMIRMTDKVMDASATKDPQNLPASWTWERFKIVVVSEATQKADDVSWSFD